MVGTGGLALRAAGTADVDAVVALVQSAYRGDPSRAGWTTEADLLAGQRTDAEAVAAEVADPALTVLLAERAGTLLACVQVADRGDGLAYVGGFAVRPGEQGAGVGRAVLAAAEEHARARGAGRVEMTVIAQRTELIAWYGRRGYAATGETRPFPYGQERFGVPLRDDLHFVVLAKDLPGG
ncbi:GNAT family N-acetyltransferase [Rhodococcus aerolatus]